MKTSFWFILLFIFSGCIRNQNVENYKSEEIDLTRAYKTKRKVNLSSVAKDIRYIKLETREECFLDKIEKIMFQDSLIFISTANTNRTQLFIFSNSGQFIRSIGKLGKGPGEYLNIRDFCVNVSENRILIFDVGRKLLLQYTCMGEFLSEFETKSFPMLIEKLSSNEIALLYTYPDFASNGNHSIAIINNNGVICNQLVDRGYLRVSAEQAFHMTKSGLATFSYFCDTLTYWENNFDTIYRITGSNNFFPRYILNYGSKEKAPNNDYQKKMKEGFVLSSFLETKDYMFFPKTVYKNELMHIVFNKHNKEVFNLFFDNPDMRLRLKAGYYNDFDGGWPFLPEGVTNEGLAFCYFFGFQLNKLLKEKPFNELSPLKSFKHDELVSLLEASQVLDNPIIMMVEFKQIDQ